MWLPAWQRLGKRRPAMIYCAGSADGEWGPWHLDQESGENGVNWNERLWPVWAGYKGVSKGVGAVKSLFGSLRRSS